MAISTSDRSPAPGEGRECERGGRLKIGFDVRQRRVPRPADGRPHSAGGVRRIESRTAWRHVREPLEDPDPVPFRVRNPAARLDHAKQGVVAVRCYDRPAAAVEQAAREQGDEFGGSGGDPAVR